MLAIDAAIGELTQTLVIGSGDLATDNVIRGQIVGLENSKLLIHRCFEENTNGDDADYTEE